MAYLWNNQIVCTFFVSSTTHYFSKIPGISVGKIYCHSALSISLKYIPFSVHLSFKPCLSNICIHIYDLYSIQNAKFIFNPVTAKDKQKLNISISFQHEPSKRKQNWKLRETKTVTTRDRKMWNYIYNSITFRDAYII